MAEIISKNRVVASCTLHVLEVGDTFNTEVVLLHGMKFQAATWQDLGTLALLAAKSVRPLAVDMPGFGQSPACSVEQDEILEHFVAQETAGKPILLGPSMGGRIALKFAIKHPDMLSGLILVGAVGVEENIDRLAEISVPTLLIWGAEDQISPLAASELLLEKIPGSRRVIIDGAPHPCYLDHPEVFHEALLNFLDTLS